MLNPSISGFCCQIRQIGCGGCSPACFPGARPSPPHSRRTAGRRRALAAVACLALLATGAAVLPLLPSEPEPEPPVLSVPDIAPYASASDLAQAVGFPVEELSALPFQPEQTTYLSY